MKVTSKQVKEAKDKWIRSQVKYKEDQDYRDAWNNFLKVQNEAIKRNQPFVEECKLNYEKLKKRMSDKQEKKKIELPDVVDNFFKVIRIGVDWGSEFKLRWVSDDERFIIWTCPGRRSWFSIGETKYYKTTHYLSDLSGLSSERGYKCFTETLVIEKEGKLNKEVMEEMKRSIKL